MTERKSCLPVIALVLSFVSALLFAFSPLFFWFAILAIVVGASSLCKGKQKIGRVRFILAIIAILWALATLGTYFWILRLMALGLFP